MMSDLEEVLFESIYIPNYLCNNSELFKETIVNIIKSDEGALQKYIDNGGKNKDIL